MPKFCEAKDSADSCNAASLAGSGIHTDNRVNSSAEIYFFLAPTVALEEGMCVHVMHSKESRRVLSKQASKQASKHASKQASRQASRQARSKHKGKQSKWAGKQARKQSSTKALRRHSVGAMPVSLARLASERGNDNLPYFQPRSRLCDNTVCPPSMELPSQLFHYRSSAF